MKTIGILALALLLSTPADEMSAANRISAKPPPQKAVRDASFDTEKKQKPAPMPAPPRSNHYAGRT